MGNQNAKPESAGGEFYNKRSNSYPRNSLGCFDEIISHDEYLSGMQHLTANVASNTDGALTPPNRSPRTSVNLGRAIPQHDLSTDGVHNR